jgi:hypothetical protein
MKLKPILLLISCFLIIKLLSLFPTYSDETFYFNVAKQVSEGKMLYKDFFFAHPPLQTFVLALLFKVFQVSYLIAKLLPILSSAGCLLLVYLISKEDAKPPIFSTIILLLTPAFLSYNHIGYGVWPAAVLVLLSYHLLLRRKTFLSSLFLVVAFFTRYLTILYLPFLFYKSHNKRRFLVSTVVLLVWCFFLLVLLFGVDFITDTVLYHFSKLGERNLNFVMDYGSFSLFLLIPLFWFKRDKSFLLVFLADLLIMILFKAPFYHYFLISTLFYSLFLSEVKDKKLVVLCLMFGVLLNTQSILYYNAPNNLFERVDSFFADYPGTMVFGEPIIVNYLSFMNRVNVLDGLFDSYPQHLSFESVNFSGKPDFIIDSDGFYAQLFNDLTPVFAVDSIPNITIFRVG